MPPKGVVVCAILATSDRAGSGGRDAVDSVGDRLGAFLTLVFYLVIPFSLTHSGRQTSDIIVSALLGGTIVHSAIVFLFFVIVAAILDAVQLHARDRAILASFGREIDDDRKVGAKRGLSSILSDELGSAIHTRAFRLLNAAIESKTGDKPPNLAALAFDGFQAASRQFVRALLPFLPSWDSWGP